MWVLSEWYILIYTQRISNHNEYKLRITQAVIVHIKKIQMHIASVVCIRYCLDHRWHFSSINKYHLIWYVIDFTTTRTDSMSFHHIVGFVCVQPNVWAAFHIYRHLNKKRMDKRKNDAIAWCENVHAFK